MRTKSELREWAREWRGRQDSSGASDFAHFIGHPFLEAARRVAGYLSLPDEISPFPLMGHCHARGKVVAVSAWDDESKAYRFCRWVPDAPLEVGPKRIPQPVEKRWMSASDFDLFLVPGLAFGRRGERLGFGAVIYDRLLSSASPRARFVGVAHDWQLVDAIPQESHDVCMHCILTPTQTHSILI